MKSIRKALTILDAFIDKEDGIQLSDLSELTGINKPTANRILSILIECGYVKQAHKRGKYSLGMKFLNFSSTLKKIFKINNIAMPYLVKLHESVAETVVLTTFDAEKINFSVVINAKDFLRISPDEGSYTPTPCTGEGKIFFAQMSEQDLNNYIKSVGLHSFTPNTIIDPNQLKNQLMVVAKENVAYDDEEYDIGIRNVSAGIKNNEERTIAAVSVLGPTVRLTRAHMMDITSDVKYCALAISRELGYKGE